MKLVRSLLLLLALNVAGSFIERANPLPIGSKVPLPDYKLKNIQSKRVALNDIREKKGLLVIFMSNSCSYVMQNESRITEIAAYIKDKNIGIVLINSNDGNRLKTESFDAMKTYAQEQGYTFNYLMDEGHKLADAFGAIRTPECFLFDGGSRLVYHGAIDDAPADPEAVKRQHLKIAIEEMLAEKNITVNTSRIIGCGIQREAVSK